MPTSRRMSQTGTRDIHSSADSLPDYRHRHSSRENCQQSRSGVSSEEPYQRHSRLGPFVLPVVAFAGESGILGVVALEVAATAGAAEVALRHELQLAAGVLEAVVEVDPAVHDSAVSVVAARAQGLLVAFLVPAVDASRREILRLVGGGKRSREAQGDGGSDEAHFGGVEVTCWR